MSGDRAVLESQWRSSKAPPVVLPISLVVLFAIAMVVIGIFLGGILRWLVILAALWATAVAVVLITFRRAGFRRRHPPLLVDRFRRKDIVESASALVGRARGGSVYSQMVVRARLRNALVKRLAAKHAMTVAEVEDAIEGGRAEALVPDPVLLGLLREEREDRSHWTDRVVRLRGDSGRSYEKTFLDIIERTEGL